MIWYCSNCDGATNGSPNMSMPQTCPHCGQNCSWLSVPRVPRTDALAGGFSISLTGVVKPIDQT